MDATRLALRRPDPTRPAPLAPARRKRRARPTLRVGGPAAALAIALALVVSACSTTDGDSGGPAPGLQIPTAVPSAGFAASGAARDQVKVPAGGSSGSGALTDISVSALGRAQIKTAELTLRSKEVATVANEIAALAVGQGGFVDSENTTTDLHGVATTSRLTIRVPVDRFDATVTAVSRLGTLTGRRVNTTDVTGRVADVNSRVTSAEESITQLRLLFNRATRLSDIITLESELSTREADLEALQAEQRALTEQTTLATISVAVSRPRMVAPPPDKDDHAGFLGGLRQGWDALVTAFTGVSHGLGAALPLGLTILVLAGLAWAGVRRIPRRRVETTRVETSG
ncbi:MAG: DUF4349 domain-containing protein [Nocardioidaceae bacterium]